MPTGIVLMGGRSTRMGTDKALLALRGKTFAQQAKATLSAFCNEVYYSINADQVAYDFITPTVIDRNDNQGPLSGILACLEELQKPILTLAVDQVSLSHRTLEHLVNQRNKKSHATVYYNAQNNLWEATVGIWEVSSYEPLLAYYNQGGRSLQKFLRSHDVKKVEVISPHDFLNINRPEDLKDI